MPTADFAKTSAQRSVSGLRGRVMWQKVKEKFTGSTDVVAQVFDRAVKETGAALDSEAAAKLKDDLPRDFSSTCD
ncbi:MAG: hypothetical protein V4753_17885 [Pseudomonadota bacterium]